MLSNQIVSVIYETDQIKRIEGIFSALCCKLCSLKERNTTAPIMVLCSRLFINLKYTAQLLSFSFKFRLQDFFK